MTNWKSPLVQPTDISALRIAECLSSLYSGSYGHRATDGTVIRYGKGLGTPVDYSHQCFGGGASVELDTIVRAWLKANSDLYTGWGELHRRCHLQLPELRAVVDEALSVMRVTPYVSEWLLVPSSIGHINRLTWFVPDGSLAKKAFSHNCSDPTCRVSSEVRQLLGEEEPYLSYHLNSLLLGLRLLSEGGIKISYLSIRLIDETDLVFLRQLAGLTTR
jgi:hypothetical protein